MLAVAAKCNLNYVVGLDSLSLHLILLLSGLDKQIWKATDIFIKLPEFAKL